MNTKNYKEMWDSIRNSSSDAKLLKLRNLAHRDKVESIHDRVEERKWLLRTLIACSEHGKVLLVEGGMDCDCVAYEGHTRIVGSSVAEFEAALEEMYYWAEGPIHWEIKKPSDQYTVKSSSVDLALRAFEDGHVHVVYL